MRQHTFTVVIVGAGLSGICMGIKLRELQIDFIILEKNSQVSGTWTENRYPGCGCDIPMFAYCYSFEMFKGNAWPKQPEILQYFEHCVTKYGLANSISLNTSVDSAVYDEQEGMWKVTTDSQEQFKARFVVNATGQLNHINMPDFPGLDCFNGSVFHSARFPDNYRTEGKRIALVGSGATALQIVESLQQSAESIFIFSRSPKYIYPRVKYSPLTLNKMRQDPQYWQQVRERFIDAQDQYRVLLDDFPLFDPFDEHSKVKEFYAQSHSVDLDSFKKFYEWLDQHDQRPRYPTGCSRPLVSNTFHDAIRADNVTIVSDTITTFSKAGICTAGEEFNVDCAILATGFSLNNLIPPYDLQGIDGKKMSESWADGPSAYLGMTTVGFPNLFFLYGPNTNTNASSVTFFVESQVNYLGEIFSSYLSRPFKSIEPDRKVLLNYQNWLLEKSMEVSESASCSSWYKNTQGLNISTFPGSFREYQKLTRTFVEAEYRIVPIIASSVKKEVGIDRLSVLEDLIAVFSKTTLLSREDINADAALRDFGLDSILIVDFIKKLNLQWSMELQPAVFFEYETLSQLAEYLHANIQSIRTDAEAERRVPLAQKSKPSISAAQIALWKKNRRMVEAVDNARDQFSNKDKNIRTENKDIAIIGAHGYFPEAKSLSRFWQNLREEKCSIKEVPEERWDWRTVAGDPHDGNNSKSKWGGFLEDVDLFDPQFFKINPKEASLMDPQHRLFLQCAWELIEESGYDPDNLAGKKIGVIVGVNLNDYAEIVQRHSNDLDVMEITGLMHLFAANRLSYLLGLTGPSEVIDTACSSSLIAVHRAVQAIRYDQCEMMIVGGANLMLTPRMHILYSKAGMLCEDGRCKTFSQGANGYVRGEGIAAILLKRLSRAEEDGDHILGVIKGSAENHGGKANSLTAPNPNLQADLIVSAVRNADVDPRSIGYIECHGTGTRLGDPVEINGLIKAFKNVCEERGIGEFSQAFCALGSVKSNIGHLETTAGIAGLIKVLLGFKHQYIPASLFSEPLNSQINLNGTPFYINSKGKTWDAPVIADKTFPRCAGVSSFGAGGSNAHVILEEYKSAEQNPSDKHQQIIIISGRNLSNLRACVASLAEYLDCENLTDSALPSIAYTLQTGRKALDTRAAFVVDSVRELIQKLYSWLASQSTLEKEVESRLKSVRQSEEMLDSWIANGNYHELAAYWEQGGNVSWADLYKGKCIRRISLPARPFLQKRFWVDTARTEATPMHSDTFITSADKNRKIQAVATLHKKLQIGDNRYSAKPSTIQLASLDNWQVAVPLPQHNVSSMQIILNATDDSIEHAGSTVQELPMTVSTAGVGVIAIDTPTNKLNTELVKMLSNAIERAAQAPDLSVLVLKGNGVDFLHGPSDTTENICRLYEKLAAFPFPVIAAVNGHATGSGFVIAALCDLMICSLSCHYDIGERSHLLPNEYTILEERFGSERVFGFVNQTQEVTGQVLKELGWTNIFASNSDFKKAVDKYVLQFSSKSKKALSVLKKHLARNLLRAAQSSVQPVSAASSPTDLTIPIRSLDLTSMVFPEFRIKPILHDSKILEIGLGVLDRPDAMRRVVDDLSEMLSQLQNSQINVVVVTSEYSGFLPFGSDAQSQNLAFELALLLEQFSLPVIAVLDKGASDLAWFVALHADACIYDRSAVYQTGVTCVQDNFIQRLIARLSSSLGPVFAREMILTNTLYQGEDLARRAKWIFSGREHEVLAQGLDLAKLWSRQPREKLVAWKRRQYSQSQEHVRILPAWRGEENSFQGSKRSSSDKTDFVDVSLSSEVMKVSCNTDGIVVVRMEDNQAKNMFSDAFVKGIKEVFAHINQNPAYKVVILQGYDNYFASGGTREALLAIQEGRLNFTDSEVKIYQLALECKIPVIAAMQGHGIGAGWSFGMFADMHIFSSESKYFSPYMKFHFTPGAGSTLVLPHYIGHDLAFESLYTGYEFSGSDFAERGMVQTVVPRSEVFSLALSLATKISKFSKNDLVQLKKLFTENLHLRLDDTYKRELAMHSLTFVGQTETLNQIQTGFGVRSTIKEVISSAPENANASTVDQQVKTVTSLIKALLAQELHLKEVDISEKVNFVDLGLDSISGVTWIRKINQHFDISLEATQIYAHPNLELLAEHIVELTGSSVSVSAQEDAVQSIKASGSAIADDLRTWLADELHMDTRQIGMQTQFVDMGLDSISGVTWIRRINEKYQINLEATVIYSYPTLAQLSEHLGQILPFETDPAAYGTEIFHPVLADNSGNKLAATQNRNNVQPLPERDARQCLDIAIIGMDGQFPGAGNLDCFWENLAAGKNCITEVDKERWDTAQYFVAERQEAGKTLSKWMGALENYRCFDPLFFNVSPTEARDMDPQQRLFLQCCWLAIENAGYDPESLSGSACSVFVGCGPGDYRQLSRAQRVSAHGFTGDAASILAARISYFLNLKGPGISIDTACSSSLVAIALACDNLVSGGADLALAGGVCVMATPEMHIMTSQAGMLSPNGRCAAFDENANGIVLGEGVGVIVLKRLADAESDGDQIQAVIKGWGVNQDGKTNGITAPNPESQSALQKSIFRKFNINPSDIQYVETHGTGTSLGDPIEVSALKASFKNYTDKSNYCALGSVKSNIGHTLMAAGVASTIKVVLSLKNKKLPPTINFKKLNPHINLENSPFYINTELCDWQVPLSEQRMAAISSFSFSGTNAHLVVAEYPASLNAQGRNTLALPSSLKKNIAILSARTREQLEQKAHDLHGYVQNMLGSLIDGEQITFFNKIIFTLQNGRTAMDERLAMVVGDLQELAEKLNNFINAKKASEYFSGRISDDRDLINILGHDRSLSAGIADHFVKTHSYEKLAELWVRGFDIDWKCFYQDSVPGRTELPGYPFARETFWIDEADEIISSKAQNPFYNYLHPLVHVNSSSLRQQQFTSLFNGREFFLRDHLVRINESVPAETLPGVAYLEIARAAYALSSDSLLPDMVAITDVVWLRPFTVQERNAELAISLQVLNDNHTESEKVEFDIFSTQTDDAYSYCRGFVEGKFTKVEVKRLNVDELKSEASIARLDIAKTYEQFAQVGLHYGDAHRALAEVFVGDKQSIAELRLPPSVIDSSEEFYLHPSMMDCALQACISLIWQQENKSTMPLVPFSLEQLNIYAPCCKEMIAWVRFSDAHLYSELDEYFDIDLCNTRGDVCVEMRGFNVRYLRHIVNNESNQSRLIRNLPTDGTAFDSEYYGELIDKLRNAELSVEEAVELS